MLSVPAEKSEKYLNDRPKEKEAPILSRKVLATIKL